jgi:hypothetical protein
MTYKKPTRQRDDGLKQYEEPKEGHTYFMSVDVSRGAEIDYHVVTVIDITEMPYKIAAIYRNNQLAPMLLPNIVNALGQYTTRHGVLSKSMILVVRSRTSSTTN